MKRVVLAALAMSVGAPGCGSGNGGTAFMIEAGPLDAVAVDEVVTATDDASFDVLTASEHDELESAADASNDGSRPWLLDARTVVRGSDASDGGTQNCRSGAVCPHNQDTDLARFGGRIYLAYRKGISDVLGPNSAIAVASSSDGETFQTTAVLPSPIDRDIRAPHFLVVGNKLCILAVTRLPAPSPRDAFVAAAPVVACSADGSTWGMLSQEAAAGWAFWRAKEHGGTYYAIGYPDGELSVALFSSTDGTSWKQGSDIYSVKADTPTESEIVFLPSGRLLALVRLNGTDAELDGSSGRLRTKLCWADAPYTSFSCPGELSGARFDGPVAFLVADRLFVVARKHLQPSLRKRTALYELIGDFASDTVTSREWGELPSAADTSYAGALLLDDGRWLLSWYSGDVKKDDDYTAGRTSPTDVWRGIFDPAALRAP